MEIKLLVLVGKHKGRRITLPLTQFVIGRDPNCHLRPVSTEVSKLHCAIARSGPKVMVRDLKSTNGTYLNDKRVTGTVRVKDGDVLGVGPLKFLFQFVHEDEGEGGQAPSSMDWLLRTPSEREHEVLDSASDTTIIKGLSEEDEEVEKAGQRGTEAGKSTGAVAGELLREQLEQQKKPGGNR